MSVRITLWPVLTYKREILTNTHHYIAYNNNNNNNNIYVLIEFQTTGMITGHHYNGPIELHVVSSLIENKVALTAIGRTFFSFLVKYLSFKKRTIHLYIIPLFYNCVHWITSPITLSRYKTYYYRMYSRTINNRIDTTIADN